MSFQPKLFELNDMVSTPTPSGTIDSPEIPNATDNPETTGTSTTPDASKIPHLKRKYIPFNRNQIEFKIESLDSSLPLDHDARTIWKFVNLLDLSKAEEAIASLKDYSGRPTIHPKIIISLWIYGISKGIVSGRKIAENCKDHRGFAWICGGISIGHHVLSNFRSKHCELFEDLVVQTISILVSEELIELKEVAQDGVKINANASKESFRRKPTLKKKKAAIMKNKAEIIKYIQELEDQQKKGLLLKEEKRKKKRELTEALKKEKRINETLKELENFKNQKNKNRSKHKNKKLSNKEVRKLRSSTTDPESRKMRMADGSFKAAYNFQIATEVNSELALGVRGTQNGTDGGEMLLMYQHLMDKHGKTIKSYIVDDGYTNISDVQALYEQGTHVYMPTEGKSKSKREKILSEDYKGESEAAIEWVKRMETEEAKEIYKKRIRVSETINAYFRNHGLGQMLVRGLRKSAGVVNLFCLAYNMTIIERLFSVL